VSCAIENQLQTIVANDRVSSNVVIKNKVK